jgi:peroxiredoxin
VREVKRQKAQEAYKIQRTVEAERKPRKWLKRKLIFGFLMVAIWLAVFGAGFGWLQYCKQLPSSNGLALDFSLKDINGTLFSLSQFRGNVIIVNFMNVPCGGQISPISDNQLTQMKKVCDIYVNKSVTIVTVAVLTCGGNELAAMRANYSVTWFLGNDYDDGKLDIVNAYAHSYSVQDGALVIIDKTFNVAQVYTQAITVETLSSQINQLLGTT